MSSKKRPPKEGEVAQGHVDHEQSIGPSTNLEQEGFQHSMSATARMPDVVPIDVVLAAAQPLMQHTMLALQLRVPSREKLGRFQEILNQSSLSVDSKIELGATLALKESQSATVHRAMVEHIGGDSEELRASVWDCLEQCSGALDTSHLNEEAGSLRLESGQELELSTSMESMNVSERANLLVGDLVSQLAGQGLESTTKEQGGASVAVRNLCRALYLAVQFEEEEEEEEDWTGPELE